MITFLIVLAVILGCLAAVGLLVKAILLVVDDRFRPAAGIVAGLVLLLALVITWAIETQDNASGRCGAGTTRVEYRHAKATEHVCERTPQ